MIIKTNTVISITSTLNKIFKKINRFTLGDLIVGGRGRGLIKKRGIYFIEKA